MREVNKGASPKDYDNYRDARDDLASRIGWFCSYCEMGVRNLIEIEHVIPLANGGEELSWENFLLSCRYCNGIKSNRNHDRNGYLWPDVDATSTSFIYDRVRIIQSNPDLSSEDKQKVHETINLMGLDRFPGGENEPTLKDTRWQKREEVWQIAMESLNDWEKNTTDQMANQIARTALGHGFFSIWITVFHGIDEIISKINQIFPETRIDS